MTIYTTAARVAKHNVCEGGQARTAAALAREGKTMDTVVTMQNILRSLGLTDALYSFAEVEPGSTEEATKRLREYMRHLAAYTATMLLIKNPEFGAVITEANKPLNKRCDGLIRAAFLRKAYVAVARLRQTQTDPATRFWLQAYMELLTPKKDYLSATHATVAFLEACKAANIYGEGLHTLTAKLADILGPDPNDTTPTYEEGVSNGEGW